MLSIKNLTASIKKQTILNDISLEINAGEIVVLMGPNGSGKSSLAQIIAGNPAYKLSGSSKLFFSKADLISKTPDQRFKLGIFTTFQNPPVISGIKVFDLLRNIDKNSNSSITPLFQFSPQIQALCKKINLNFKILDRDLSSKLSGGERKKIELLQFLLITPKLIIFDEIDAGLDIDTLKNLASIIKQKNQKEKTSFLIISHNSGLIKNIDVNKVMIINKGKIVKVGDKKLITEIEINGYAKNK